jgi:hypothetical protein
LIVVAPLLPLFLPSLPALLLPLLSANTITTVAAAKTTALIPSATAKTTATGFFCSHHHFLSVSTAHRQCICRVDTPSVSAAVPPLPLPPMPWPPPFLPRQTLLLKIANLQVGRRQQRLVAADTMIKSDASKRSILDNISLF